MNKPRFTKEQIKDLLNNKNVAGYSGEKIIYNPDFKVLAIKRYQEEAISNRQIFEDAGFDVDLIGKDIPRKCLNRWQTLFRLKGYNGLINHCKQDHSRGRPKTKGLSDADKIERLEATVTYLKAENDFLIKLRSGKAE